MAVKSALMAGLLLMLMMLQGPSLILVNAVNPGCRCVVFDSMYGKEHGIFTSPNWPTPYEANMDCLLYTFIGGPDDIVELTFDEFDVQKMSFECLYGDFVRLFLHLNETGVDASSGWNSLLCGKEADIEQVHYSSGRTLVFEFHTDWRHGDNTGFRGTYRFIGRSNCLNSPDMIVVHDGKDKLARVIGQFCNTNYYVELLSTGPDMYVEFISRSHFPGQGFKASYHFEEELHYALGAPSTGSSCDQLFSSSAGRNGSFVSPGYPDGYPPDTRCTYHFSGEGIERAQIIFLDFDLFRPEESYHTCDGADVVMVFISINGQRDRVDNFCGQDLPNQVMSTGRNLTLEFRSHHYAGNVTVRGFRALYQFVTNFGITTGRQDTTMACGFAFNSSDSSNGTFTSPNWPGVYPRDTECHYFFHGLPGEKVFVEFAYFDIEGLPPCTAETASDYIEFSNFHTADRKIPRHCGMQKPSNVESEGDFFRVTFKTNDRFDGTGFSAQYQFRSIVGKQ
ncbi:hypothetical protein IscW_ISCW016962 [Ixodes scapularis]|uniref:CUB domain-containing protein n=1 Tax=Ixodes scapularis TaxID=6945 RepID=B7PBS6_IXOSC|nr:hypothetical protein IscW_ISCW016962 [Ixodes scapularis]|eukprot:XP_002408824.1 hypothetical protein IscW_ISCW016962 [Ixodes scapularis]